MNKSATISFIVCLIITACSFVSRNTRVGPINSAAGQNDSIAKQRPHGQGRRPYPYPAILQKYFTHAWSGVTACNGDTLKSPASLNITRKDSIHVYITGLQLHKTKLLAGIRGYELIIQAPQEHINREESLAGSFIISNDFHTLTGSYTIKRGGHTDSCTAIFYPAK